MLVSGRVTPFITSGVRGSNFATCCNLLFFWLVFRTGAKAAPKTATPHLLLRFSPRSFASSSRTCQMREIWGVLPSWIFIRKWLRFFCLKKVLQGFFFIDWLEMRNGNISKKLNQASPIHARYIHLH